MAPFTGLALGDSLKHVIFNHDSRALAITSVAMVGYSELVKVWMEYIDAPFILL